MRYTYPMKKLLLAKIGSGFQYGAILAILSLPALLAHADTTSSGGGGAGTIANPLNAPTLLAALADAYNAFAKFAYIVLVFFFVYAGFMFVTARGNPEKLETAKRMLLYTVIGAALILGGQVIAALIQGTVNQLTG
jgi:hypothetical protein